MNRSVTLENETFRVQVYPQIGGKVASIVDKADGFELLYNYPDELPTTHVYDAPYGEHWFAGWDECFPSVAASNYVGHPYDGIRSPDHGELWGLPTTAVPTLDGITTVWQGLRFGYRLTRKLHLVGASLLAEYTLVNLAPFPFRFVWAMHALMSSKSRVEIKLGEIAMRRSHLASGQDVSGDFTWPMWEDRIDLSQPGKLPADRGWKSFSQQPISGPIEIVYPERGRSVTMAYESETVPAYWGVWVNTGGWLHHQHFAIEPMTGRSDHIDRAIRDGSAATIEPSGMATWSTKLTLGGA